MYVVTKCWGVEATPFNVINDTLIAASVPEFVNTTPVAENDNVIIWTASTEGAAPPVSLAATVSGDSATVTATAWTFNPATFQSTPGPLADANVIDPTTGESLGTTDADGSITVTVPESGIVAVEGLAAIRVTIPGEGEGEGEGGGGAPVISWDEAKNYIGETVTIEAQAFEKIDSGTEWVLFIGAPSSSPDTVGIEVEYSDLSKFPEDLYAGKTIRITGELHANPVGGASFSLTDPSQVEIVE
jgi:hypothetical protein